MKKYIALIVVLAAFASGYKVAAMQYQLEISEMKLQAETDAKVAVSIVRIKEQRLQAITDKYNQLLANPTTVYKTITKEVIQYVKNDDIAKCMLNDDWVLLHDKAARADNATRSTDTANAASRAVRDDSALTVIVSNYQRCNSYMHKLEAWQNWWSEIKDAY